MKSFVISIPIDENLNLCLARLGQKMANYSQPIAEAAHEGQYSEYIVAWSEDSWAGDAFKVEIVDLPIVAIAEEYDPNLDFDDDAHYGRSPEDEAEKQLLLAKIANLRPDMGVQICGLEFLG